MYLPHSREEKKLTDDAIQIMEWIVREDGIIIDDIMPIVMNKKILVDLSVNSKTLDRKFLTFRPLKNNKQCMLLIDRLYEEEEIKTIKVIKNEETDKFDCVALDENGDSVNKVFGFDTETEGLFCLFYTYYFDDSIYKYLKGMKEFDAEAKRRYEANLEKYGKKDYKKEQEEKKNGSNKRTNRSRKQSKKMVSDSK